MLGEIEIATGDFGPLSKNILLQNAQLTDALMKVGASYSQLDRRLKAGSEALPLRTADRRLHVCRKI